MNSVYGFDYFGYIPSLATPKADYLDFQHVVMDKDSLLYSLQWGHLPPGLLLRNRKTIYQVFGPYGQRQRLIIQGRTL